MQVNLEQIIEGVRALPFEDLNRLREVIDEERESANKLTKPNKSNFK